MATSKGNRVAAFLLAGLFLLTTIGTTAYVLWQINQDDVLVSETEQDKIDEANAQAAAQNEEAAEASQACGAGTFAAVEPREIPSVTTSSDVTELETTDVRVGDGEEVQPGDCVAALYYGTLASDGTRFDGNYATGTPIEFSLNGVIEGWTVGIPGMNVGGVRRLVIPANQAYGATERPGIPANSVLIFEVEIIAAKRGDV